METNNEFIVFRNKENGGFLEKFNNKNGVLSFEVAFNTAIEKALFLPEEFYMEDEKTYSALCDAFESEPIRVKAHYTLETLDGQPAKEIEEKEDDMSVEFKEFKKMMDKLFK